MFTALAESNSWKPFCFSLAVLAGLLMAASSLHGQEAEWIWSPEHGKNDVPHVSCHFRKSFSLRNPAEGEITIAADDQYELFVNGRHVGKGDSAKKLDRYDISRNLSRGTNLISVEVKNLHGSTAALVARVSIKERSGQWVSHSTDGTWKSELSPLPLWNLKVYNDSRWAGSQSFGALGSTVPWDRADDIAEERHEHHERFKINREFAVQRVVDNDATGSVIAMTFDEFGRIILAREGGPLLLVTDTNDDQVPDKVAVYSDKVKSCQGILALNGDVYVTGDGPDGNGLYRLSDGDRDGRLESAQTIVKFTGEPGEHGPHGLVLGPEGMIYVVVGNHSAPQAEYAPTSPHRDYYEGDLNLPRYEDPGGHAVGMKAPGGVVLRTNLTGTKIEMVAGGLRNAYDLAFNADGQLFVHDSDMESDIGTSWYRPTQVFHIVPGGEYGWRSGWAKWPAYYADSLPGIVDTGRGSPTGAVVYSHHMFPVRYHDALFLGDWSEGRIIAVTMKRDGATYTTNSEVFLQGEPLNVTDLEVGPDGALYFITGGRGTAGGIYRITWRGVVPESIRAMGDDLSATIRQPQLQSAWARQNLAALKLKMGDKWAQSLIGVTASSANPTHYRTRALELMQLYGPLPTPELLIKLSADKNEQVRAKATELLGLHATEATQVALIDRLGDGDRAVRRAACEALVRAGQIAPVASLQKLLTSDDRFEAWAARRLLERLPVEHWRDTVLTTDDARLFINGAFALLIAHPDERNARDVLARTSELMNSFVSDQEFIGMLRLAQVALIRGELGPDDVAEYRAQFAAEFPSGNSAMNHELARLLAYLQVSSIADRYFEYLESPDVSNVDKLHLAAHLRFIDSGWSSHQRLELLRFFAQARTWKGGGSYSHYVMNLSRDFAKSLHEDDLPLVLASATEWPDAALGVLYKLPHALDSETLTAVKQMDQQLVDVDDDAIKRLQVGVVAVLARSGDEDSIGYLREIWLRDPERRATVAMGLAQTPDGENWSYVLRSLPVLEDQIAREVLRKLTHVNQRPEDAEFYRQVILKGLQLKDQGGQDAVALLEHWTSETRTAEDDDWEKGIAAWQKWYHDQYPDKPDATLPKDAPNAVWDFNELLEYLASQEAATASAQRGALVYKKAKCNACHRFGDEGDVIGPDLTTISKRFTRKEILESTLYPSHMISDQYASKTVLTTSGRQFSGIVAPGADGEHIVLGTDGKKVIIAESDVDEILPNKQSAMPTGLIDSLTLQEIADLFAYFGVAPKANLARRPNERTR